MRTRNYTIAPLKFTLLRSIGFYGVKGGLIIDRYAAIKDLRSTLDEERSKSGQLAWQLEQERKENIAAQAELKCEIKSSHDVEKMLKDKCKALSKLVEREREQRTDIGAELNRSVSYNYGYIFSRDMKKSLEIF